MAGNNSCEEKSVGLSEGRTEFGLGPRVVPFRQIEIWGGGFYRGGDAS